MINNRIVFKVFATGINFIISIVIGIFVPRIIGPESYGEYSYITSTFTFLFQLFMFSSNTAYIYFLSNKKYKTEEVNSVYYIFLLVILVFVSIFTVLSMSTDIGNKFLWHDIKSYSLILVGLFFGSLRVLQTTLIAFSDSTQQTIVAEKLKLISRFIFVIALVIAMKIALLDLNLFFTLSIIYILVFSFLFFKFIRFKFQKISSKKVLSIFHDAFNYLKPLIIFSLIGAAYLYLGRYAVQATSGSGELGIYMAALNLANIPIQFLSSIVAIYMNTMVIGFANGDISIMRKFFTSDLLKIYALHSMFSFFLLFNADSIINFLFGAEYIGTVNVLKVIAIFSLTHSFGVLGGNTFMSTNRTKQYAYINGTVLFIGCMYFVYIVVYSQFSALNFAIATTSFFLIRVLIQTTYNLIFLKINILGFILKTAGIAALTALPAMIISLLIPKLIVLNGLIYAVFMIILCLIYYRISSFSKIRVIN